MNKESKTIREWAELLHEPERSSFLKQSKNLDEKEDSLQAAVLNFLNLRWSVSKEGSSYWNKIYEDIVHKRYALRIPEDLNIPTVEIGNNSSIVSTNNTSLLVEEKKGFTFKLISNNLIDECNPIILVHPNDYKLIESVLKDIKK